ncbi:MAG: DUF3297 family protein [Nitrospirae bacterium]|nr:MAG: DUF3297 family protein [Nitrospirota bacterium]
MHIVATPRDRHFHRDLGQLHLREPGLAVGSHVSVVDDVQQFAHSRGIPPVAYRHAKRDNVQRRSIEEGAIRQQRSDTLDRRGDVWSIDLRGKSRQQVEQSRPATGRGHT